MQPRKTNHKTQDKKYPTVYREVKIGNKLYCVTSVFSGEKELGQAFEKLIAQCVLDEIDSRAKDIL